ncbi:MAG: hypothetical protein F2842_04925 [Actinobacteria bacterium]|uniref:Unannotated protein n=1 Tax=freshwater metagenome TaxID=449393 RepID=A0A6J7JJW5_9ZZZZ|nr:hypothetical protein [Actinomycetota bacterium]MSW41534.1 hypothetical protein [Actinomycetota bacterium]
MSNPLGSVDPQPTTNSGFGRILVALYAIMAIGATARSVFAIATKFDLAPFAYTLSAVAAAVYIVATITLARGDSGSRRIATACITFELIGVLVVGTLSLIDPDAFRKASVWSWFGLEYLLLPLALPILGLWWLRRSRPVER